MLPWPVLQISLYYHFPIVLVFTSADFFSLSVLRSCSSSLQRCIRWLTFTVFSPVRRTRNKAPGGYPSNSRVLLRPGVPFKGEDPRRPSSLRQEQPCEDLMVRQSKNCRAPYSVSVLL